MQAAAAGRTETMGLLPSVSCLLHFLFTLRHYKTVLLMNEKPSQKNTKVSPLTSSVTAADRMSREKSQIEAKEG